MTRLRTLLLGAVALALCAAVLLGLRLSQYVSAPLAAPAPRVAIPKGAGLVRVAEILREAGVAPWKAGTVWGFRLWGNPRKIKAGIYAFKRGTRLVDVFGDLEAGRVDLVAVTFPEGWTAREMAAALEAGGVTKAQDFADLALDPASPARWELPGPTLEGYLFPDTYRFPREIPARDVVEAQVRRFRQVRSGLAPLAAQRGLSLRDWVTLASVVEKETGVEAEKPLIAAVFRNRLGLGMPLQSDPTVIYGIPDFDGNLRRSDLRRDTPYNTYVRRGLPAGPIANPGRASLEAVLNPAEVPYLYFVSRNDGSHAFSATYPEHVRAVNRFQRGRRE